MASGLQEPSAKPAPTPNAEPETFDAEPRNPDITLGSQSWNIDVVLNVPLLRASWSLLDGSWGILKGRWGLLGLIYAGVLSLLGFVLGDGRAIMFYLLPQTERTKHPSTTKTMIFAGSCF